MERVLGRAAEDLRENPVVLPHGEQTRLTFSGGACRWKAGVGVRALFSKADEALYRAKTKGGDTVVHADYLDLYRLLAALFTNSLDGVFSGVRTHLVCALLGE